MNLTPYIDIYIMVKAARKSSDSVKSETWVSE